MGITEIKIGGLGGQGVILSGIIVGKAAAIYDHKFSTMTQAFGPEARGSACSSQVIIDSEPILYPYVTAPDILVVMSQDAYNKYIPELKDEPESLLLYENDLVTPKVADARYRSFGIPATRFAEEMGRKVVLNIVMVGFFAAMTGLVGRDAMRDAVRESVPRGTEKLNLAAFDKGFAYGKEQQAAQG